MALSFDLVNHKLCGEHGGREWSKSCVFLSKQEGVCSEGGGGGGGGGGLGEI